MCGILGVMVVKPTDNIKTNLEKIYKAQKNRGSFGCGVVKLSKANVMTRKRGVQADELFGENFEQFFHNLQIGDRLLLHHRYASHGGNGSVLESNHPFIDESFNTALIHNGVISNYAELYKKQIAEGHNFESELRLVTKRNKLVQQQITDSEVILHQIDNNPIVQAKALADVQGSCAIAVLNKKTKGILLYRWWNPIVISQDSDGNYYFSSEYSERLGLKLVNTLDEGVLVRLSFNGLENLVEVRKPQVTVAYNKYTQPKASKGIALDGYKVNKNGIWEEEKKDKQWYDWY